MWDNLQKIADTVSNAVTEFGKTAASEVGKAIDYVADTVSEIIDLDVSPSTPQKSDSDIAPTSVEVFSVDSYIPPTPNPMEIVRYRHQLEQLQKHSEWSTTDFRNAIHAATQLGQKFPQLPNTVYLGMQPTIEGLLKLTQKTSVEYGKTVYMDMSTAQIIMGAYSKGDSHSVGIANIVPMRFYDRKNQLVPIGTIHSHPANFYEQHQGMHLSPEDFFSFLTAKSKLFSIVIINNRNLIAMKTSESSWPALDELLRLRLTQLWDQYTKHVSPKDQARVFTKAVCREFKLSLFLTAPHNQNKAEALKT